MTASWWRHRLSLIFAVVAQMSLHGWLAPLLQTLAGLWVTPGGRNLDLLTTLSLPEGTGLVVGGLFMLPAFWLVARNRIGWEQTCAPQHAPWWSSERLTRIRSRRIPHCEAGLLDWLGGVSGVKSTCSAQTYRVAEGGKS
ncbi:hypothetical protein [Rhodobacter capsulatus]|uniref:hypothetical protein n=1 Tax=Rhodobacter capsulatus TaxID=1061 RepID=UPI004025F127